MSVVRRAAARVLRRLRPGESRLRWGFAPLKHNAPTAPVVDYLARLIACKGLQVLATTEAQMPGLLPQLRERLGPGWRVERVHEYLVAWDRSRVAGRPRSPLRRRRLTDVSALEDWRNLFVALRGLRDRTTGRPILLVVGHCPAGIEKGSGYRKDRPLRVLASKVGLRRIGRLVRNRVRAVRGVVVVVMLDLNLDELLEQWREYATTVLGAESVWEGRLPEVGDHGRRLIAVAHVAGVGVVCVYAEVVTDVRRPGALDHRSIVFVLDIRPLIRKART